MPGYIHHIQWCVHDFEKTVHKLTKEFGFTESCRRDGNNREVLVENGTVRFLISQRVTDTSDKEAHENNSNKKTEYPWLQCKCRTTDQHTIDSVFNICLEVGDVQKVYTNCVNGGVDSLLSPIVIKEEQMDGHDDVHIDGHIDGQDGGEIQVAVVCSPCENIIHTLINTSKYSGYFLPGFTKTTSSINKKTDGSSVDLDHVTYVCRPGQSKAILQWYSDVCGMSRFTVSQDDEQETGITISGEAGMRMMVGEWMSEWLCNETGVSWEGEDEISRENLSTSAADGLSAVRNFKLVLAEPLPDHPHSHVNNFIREHGGPGVQHIGLLTPDIVTSVGELTAAGAKFRQPPPTYYQLQHKINDIVTVGYNPELFQKLGILIDKEDEIYENDTNSDNYNLENNKYILQLFTHPLFASDTFFLELIQRHGARGFGAGNIKALAQSIILLQQKQNNQKETHENNPLKQNKDLRKSIDDEIKIRKEG